MPGIAVQVEGLGKKYRLGEFAPFRTAIHGIARMAVRLRSRGSAERGEPPMTQQRRNVLWALRNVSFDVERGEILGIIGSNGAGKSTLLKVLSRITQPSEGYAKIHGRVGSLLEVGTGFHPELTGRENVYLNGSILGMKRSEIDQRFDEIVAFSGLERFLDTPVKRYSSGMYVRLGFAVAAHLRPEILLVDEVLAVGDAEFRTKCRQKLTEESTAGATILYVSHNLPSVAQTCDRVLLVDEGRIADEGSPSDVISRYLLTPQAAAESGDIPEGASRGGTGEALVRRVEVQDMDSNPAHELFLGQSFRVETEIEVLSALPEVTLEVGVSSSDGTRVASSFTIDGGRPGIRLDRGRYRIVLDLAPFLLPRQYMIDVGIHMVQGHGSTVDYVTSCVRFEVLNMSKDGADRHLPAQTRGMIRPASTWHAPVAIETPEEDASSRLPLERLGEDRRRA